MPAAREDSSPAWHEIVRTTLRANDVRLVVHVPDNVLKPLIAALDADDFFTVFPATREEEAVGIVAGAVMGGLRGIVPVSYTHLTLPTIYSV